MTGQVAAVLWNIVRNAINFIEDSGSMTPETIPKLFVLFEQADPARHRRCASMISKA